mmetsp:Transcript_13694/g.30025  ORF Transcript_13694/g.30025 Transcript_13694/m.30025 type:complete len:193 (+) Transcript_13694:115-693(+)
MTINSDEKQNYSILAGGFGFGSGHVLINHTREQMGRSCLRRSRALDKQCQNHAQVMAAQQKVFHSVQSIQELKALVQSQHAGENIQVGACVKEIHRVAVQKKTSAYKNMMCRDFVEFGMATVKGDNGKLYMVQLFRGKIEPRPPAQVIDLGDACPCQHTDKSTTTTTTTTASKSSNRTDTESTTEQSYGEES